MNCTPEELVEFVTKYPCTQFFNIAFSGRGIRLESSNTDSKIAAIEALLTEAHDVPTGGDFVEERVRIKEDVDELLVECVLLTMTPTQLSQVLCYRVVSEWCARMINNGAIGVEFYIDMVSDLQIYSRSRSLIYFMDALNEELRDSVIELLHGGNKYVYIEVVAIFGSADRIKRCTGINPDLFKYSFGRSEERFRFVFDAVHQTRNHEPWILYIHVGKSLEYNHSDSEIRRALSIAEEVLGVDGAELRRQNEVHFKREPIFMRLFTDDV